MKSFQLWLTVALIPVICSTLFTGHTALAKKNPTKTKSKPVACKPHPKPAEEYIIISPYDTPPIPQIVSAVDAGDIKTVKRLLTTKPKLIKYRAEDNDTLLHIAAYSEVQSTKMVQLLLDHGLDINARGDWNCTPLFSAVNQPKCTTAMVEFLISKGANVNAVNNDRDVPLHHVARLGKRVDILNILISHGAKVNPAPNRVSPLHDACGRDSEPRDPIMVAALISVGANVKARDDCGLTPLHYAARADNPDPRIIDILVRAGADVNAREDTEGVTPLACAVMMRVKHGSFGQDHLAPAEAVTALLKLGADVNAKDKYGVSILMMALGEDSDNAADIAKILIANGADLSAKSLDGQTVLMYSTVQPEIAVTLIEKGNDVNAASKNGVTALMFACSRWNKLEERDKISLMDEKTAQFTELLISHGANVNARDKENHTAMHYVELFGDPNSKISKVLKSHGATK